MTRFLILILLWAFGTAARAELPDNDRTLAPYFKVLSKDSSIEQLPLKSVDVDLRITGSIAHISTIQVYANEGTEPIEALYVFPASTQAAVHGLNMTIGNRTIRAEIRERKRARNEYDSARAEGKTAALLEQQRPNVFTMNVANILPGDTIEVSLQYTELIVPSEGLYEFVYPAVVGPRYSNRKGERIRDEDKFVASPYSKEPVPPLYTFGIDVAIDAGMPIASAFSPSHTIALAPEGLTRVQGEILPDTGAGNRDFILQYRLAADEIAAGLLLYEGERENFFQITVEPPKRIDPRDIPNREYIFVVDVSGSMHGFPLNVSKQLIRDLIAGLSPDDRFNVLTFASGSKLFSPASVPATSANAQRAIHFLTNTSGGGGTELLPALRRAMALPRDESASRIVVIATDGYIDVEKEAFEIIRLNLDNTNVFAFGIGSSPNRYLIDGLARVGMGEPFVVTDERSAPEKSALFRRYISAPVMTSVRFETAGFDAYDITPPTLPDLFAQRPVIVTGKWRGDLEGVAAITGTSGGRGFRKEFTMNEHRPSKSNRAIRHLWARREIARLDDYAAVTRDDTSINALVLGLGLRYGLLSAQTSFVAIEEIARRGDTGDLITVQQVLPLPEGVSNYAVGFQFGAIRRVTSAMGRHARTPELGHFVFPALSMFGLAISSALAALIRWKKS